MSAGNAAQGVALAAREAGAPASVLVMEGAPATKLAAIERLGATIVKASFDEAWKAVEAHQSDRMTGRMVHPFDDDDFISGNGTCGLEILEDLPDVDAVVAPMGGGGLLSGLGVVMRALRPTARMYAAEPENAAPLQTSLAAGKASASRTGAARGSTAPAARRSSNRCGRSSRSTWTSRSSSRSTTPPAAMKLAAERCHVIAEGAACCAIAAALSPKLRERGHKRVVAVVSGGNIDLSRFAGLVHACS